MKTKLLCILRYAALLSAAAAYSTPVIAEWSGGIEGGAVQQENGTATRLRLKLYNHARPLTHDLYIDWTRGNSGSGGGNDSYDAGYIPRYWFSQKLYGFGEILLNVDKPLGIEQENQFLVGMGYRFITSETQALWAEVGTGYRSIEFRDNLEEQEESLLVGRGGFRQSLAELFQLELDVKATQGESVTDLVAEAGISVFIGTGYLKYGYRTRRITQDNQPSVTDSDNYFGFVYGF